MNEVTPDMSGEEVSRYVTVFHQLKDTEHSEAGERVISLGEEYDDRYVLDEETEGFIPVARPIAVIDVGVEMDNNDLGEWCNSHAGKAALEPYFPNMEPDDATLPDCEEYLEGSA